MLPLVSLVARFCSYKPAWKNIYIYIYILCIAHVRYYPVYNHMVDLSLLPWIRRWCCQQYGVAKWAGLSMARKLTLFSLMLFTSTHAIMEQTTPFSFGRYCYTVLHWVCAVICVSYSGIFHILAIGRMVLTLNGVHVSWSRVVAGMRCSLAGEAQWRIPLGSSQCTSGRDAALRDINVESFIDLGRRTLHYSLHESTCGRAPRWLVESYGHSSTGTCAIKKTFLFACDIHVQVTSPGRKPKEVIDRYEASIRTTLRRMFPWEGNARWEGYVCASYNHDGRWHLLISSSWTTTQLLVTVPMVQLSWLYEVTNRSTPWSVHYSIHGRCMFITYYVCSCWYTLMSAFVWGSATLCYTLTVGHWRCMRCWTCFLCMYLYALHQFIEQCYMLITVIYTCRGVLALVSLCVSETIIFFAWWKFVAHDVKINKQKIKNKLFTLNLFF